MPKVNLRITNKPMKDNEEYKEDLANFKSYDLSHKKRLLIEAMVFQGWDIRHYCEQYNLLTAKDVNAEYKRLLIEKYK